MPRYVIVIGIILGLIIAVWFGLHQLRNKVAKDINDFYRPMQREARAGFLDGIHLDDGVYALYVNHKEQGAFMVLDEKAIKENMAHVKIKVSWLNYLPGEGDRSFGMTLFKDGQLVKQVSGGLFKTFDIGTLASAGIPVKKHRLDAVKKVILEKQSELEGDTERFILMRQSIPDHGREFHFRVRFPTIALPVQRAADATGYERITHVDGIPYSDWQRGQDGGFDQRWTQRITDYIRQHAGDMKDYDLSVSYGTTSDAYLFSMMDTYGSELQGVDGRMLYMKDDLYINYEAYIGAKEGDARRLMAIDFTDCINPADRRRPALLDKMKVLVSQSSKPHLSVENSEVGLSGYRDQVKKSKSLYEQEYTISWLTLEDEKR